MARGRAVAAVVAVAAVALALVALIVGGAGPDGGRTVLVSTAVPAPEATPLPAPGASIPSDPRTLATALAATTRDLDAAIDRWRSGQDPSAGGPPRDVALLAHHQQRIYRRLGRRPALLRAIVPHVPPSLRAEVRDNVLARRELALITSVRRGPPPRLRVGPAEPADVLRAHYRSAWRRFGVGPPLLAAVNFVETAFGRMRNRSVSGARGPMQFMPATWRAYGMGGDINDPRDAIHGAANYLRASGAPADEREALHHYNPSARYVSAVSRYARRIRADERAFYAYYAWQVYAGGRRLTDPPA